MRCCFAVVAALVLLPAAQAQETAQQLYETMERKLAKAPGVTFTFAIEGLDKTEATVKLKGSALLAADYRAKLTVEGQIANRAVKGVLTNDGKALAWQLEVDGKRRQPTR